MESKNYSLRDTPSRRFSRRRVPPDFIYFVCMAVLPNIKFKGYKRTKKLELAIHAIHNLVLTGLVDRCVADSRRKTAGDARLRVAVWDAIEAAGYARKCRGSEVTQKVTRYGATNLLLNIRKKWRLPELTMTPELERNSELETPTSHALVYGHSGRVDLATGRVLPPDERRQPLPIPNGWVLEQFREFEDSIEAINESNTEHSWQAYQVDEETGQQRVFQPNPCLKQIHVGSFFRAMRLYTYGDFGGQSLPKAIRRTMRIDGEPVTELDFQAMHIRMVYHIAKEEAWEGDLYHPAFVFPRFYAMANVGARRRALVRSFVKRATNVCLNTADRWAANGAAIKIVREHPERNFLTNLLKNTEGITPAEVIDRIAATHPPAVVEHFFCDWGSWLMTLDGLIMLRILESFAAARLPVMAIHDSLVVRECDREFARDTMDKCYFKIVKQHPEISTVY